MTLCTQLLNIEESRVWTPKRAPVPKSTKIARLPFSGCYKLIEKKMGSAFGFWARRLPGGPITTQKGLATMTLCTQLLNPRGILTNTDEY